MGFRRVLILCLVTGFAWLVLSLRASAQPPVFFFGSMGDQTQRYDGAGSIDDPNAALYAAAPKHKAFYAYSLTFPGQPFGWQPTDDLQQPVNSLFPFLFYGYSPFNPNLVQYAFFRFDFYFDRARIGWQTDNVWFWDEVTPRYSPSQPGWAGVVTQGFWLDTPTFAGVDKVWLSFIMDLVDGNVYAYEVNQFGNPVRYFGIVGQWNDPAARARVLQVASDGDLYGHVSDDLVPSYMAFYGVAVVPEPSSLLVLTLGVAGIALRRLRR
ncbi:MAG: PEP-CTERM sorting domain-containing protein [Armatimonadota bacterium]|nr:PEP-CTERM sorting domain-containing protein [Armatimonadota bacterium]